MGRGNVCVTGPYEGLFYIDNDYTDVYRCSDICTEDMETCLLGNLDAQDLRSEEWVFDEWGSAEEMDDVLQCFIDNFCRRYNSFSKPLKEIWISSGVYARDRTRHVLLENKLFYICAEDNQWSTAIELIQKDDPYDDHLLGLQKKHYQRYLEAIKMALLERVPSIGAYECAWTHKTITRQDVGLPVEGL